MALRRGILLLGSAGSGKGTQARLLQERLGLRHLDFGACRRLAVEQGTPVGQRIAALGDLVSRGKFFGNDLANDIFVEALHSDDSDVVVLDGYPRNVAQLQMLRESMQLQLAVVLDAPFETLLQRTDGRLIHTPSGRTYHPTLRPPRTPMSDDVTGEPLTVRALSSELNAEAALAKRCEIEQAEIGPLVHHLEQEGLLERLDASGAAEEVYASLLDVLSARGIPWRARTPCAPRAPSGVTLPAATRAQYREKGWVCVEGVLDAGWVLALREAVDEILAASARSATSTAAFDVEVGHSAASPMLRKIKHCSGQKCPGPRTCAGASQPRHNPACFFIFRRPALWHHLFGAVALEPRVLDVVEQLLAGDSAASSGGVRWQGDKIVVKMPHVGQPVVCHQDWAFYPHTNDDLCTVSVVLEDMSLDRGGLCYVPGSHRGAVYAHHDASGQFIGGLADRAFDPCAVEWEGVQCPAGSLIVHHARTVHASPRNASPTLRPLLLLQYAANDAWPLQQHARGAWGVDPPPGHALDEWAFYCRSVLRGEPTRRARLENVPASLPVPWPGRGGLGSLYSQLDHVETVLDPATATIASVGAAASVIDVRTPDAPPLGSPPSSARQFASLWARRASADALEALEWQRLMQFVGAGPYGSLSRAPRSRATLQAALLEAVRGGHEVDDDDVYDALHAAFHGRVVGSAEHAAASSWAFDRTGKRAEEVAVLAQRCRTFEPQAAALLDVGCADGAITAALGQRLGLRPAAVHGCDSKEQMLVGEEATSAGFTYTQLPPQNEHFWWGGEAVLPYEDASFDLVTALMTLHHVRNLKPLLDDVRRVLRPGGLFIFREHDCHSRANAAVVDIMHGMHYRTWAPADHPNYRGRGWLGANYSAFYQSAEGWNMAVTAAGLAPHHVMGPRLRPGGDAEAVWRSTDEPASGSALHGEALATQLQVGGGEQQVVHCVDPKRVVFGVYLK